MWFESLTRRISQFLLATVVITGTGCDQTEESGQTATIRFVVNSNTSNLVPFLATDQKLWEKNGLQVDLILAATGAESNEMILSGRATAATLGLRPCVVSWANGAKMLPLAKYRDGGNMFAIAVRRGAGIRRIEDLKDKTVALAKGTDPETGFHLALKAHGLSASDVRIIDASWENHAALLERGEIDAAITNEPFGTRIEQTMAEKVKLLTRLDPYYANGGLVLLHEEIVKNEPKTAEKFVTTIWEGHQLVRENPELAVESLKKWLKLDDDTCRATLELFGARPLISEGTLKDLQLNAELLKEQKKIKAVPDLRELMEPGLKLQEALQKIPGYKDLLP